MTGPVVTLFNTPDTRDKSKIMTDLIKVATNAELDLNVNIYGTPEEPLFKAGEVALLLWKPSKVVGEKSYPHMEKLRKALNVNDSLQSAKNFITEKQFYKAILKSQSQVAEPMYDWLSEEVLPSIRMHGGYISEEANVDEVLLGNIIDKCKGNGRPSALIQQFINSGRPSEKIAELVEAFNKVKPDFRLKGYKSLHKTLSELAEDDRDYRDIYLTKTVSLDQKILSLNNRINGGYKAHLKRQLNELNKEMEPALFGARMQSNEGLAWYVNKLTDLGCTDFDFAQCHPRDRLKSGKPKISIHARFGETTKSYFIWWMFETVSYPTGEYSDDEDKAIWSDFKPQWDGTVAFFEYNGFTYEIDFTNFRGIAYKLPQKMEEVA